MSRIVIREFSSEAKLINAEELGLVSFRRDASGEMVAVEGTMHALKALLEVAPYEERASLYGDT